MTVPGVIRYIRERVQDATTSRKGVIKLAGDLGGTADSPTVRSLSPEVTVGIAGGGTGADLSTTGPGALVQAATGDPITVETLDPSRGGTGVDNASRTITISNASAIFAFTSGKTLTVSNSLTLAGTDGKTLTLTGALSVGADTAITGGGTIALGGKTLTVSNSLTLAGTDGKTLTLTGALSVGADTSITGGGTIALGGGTLTVPATGTAALLATAQTFTAAQKFGTGAGTAQVAIKAQAATTVGLAVEADAAQSANIMEWRSSSGGILAAIGPGGAFRMESGAATPGVGSSFQAATVLATTGQYLLLLRLIGGTNNLTDTGLYLIGRNGTGTLVDAVLTCTNATVTINGSYQINIQNSGALNWTYNYSLMRLY